MPSNDYRSLQLLRLQAVSKKTGLSKSTIYRQLQAGDFPSPVHATAGSSAWLEHEVDAWIESKAAARTMVELLLSRGGGN